MLIDAIESIAEHWDDVLRHLGAQDQQWLIVAVRDFLSSEDEASRVDGAQRLVELVAQALPASHPVRRALAREGRKLDPGVPGWDQARQGLLARVGPADVTLGRPSPPGSAIGGDAAWREAEEWVLSAPALSESDLRRSGVDPQDPGLIRLSPRDGGVRLPAFQFGPGGQPRGIVTEINRMLDAEDDPWGVADWWLGLNSWIGAIPAESIGQVDDGVLIAAARALFEEG